MICGTDFRLQTYHVEVKLPTRAYPLEELGEALLSTAREQNCEGVFLLDAELDQFNLDLPSGPVYKSSSRVGALTILSFHQPFHAFGSSFSTPCPVAPKMRGSCHQPPFPRKASSFCRKPTEGAAHNLGFGRGLMNTENSQTLHFFFD